VGEVGFLSSGQHPFSSITSYRSHLAQERFHPPHLGKPTTVQKYRRPIEDKHSPSDFPTKLCTKFFHPFFFFFFWRSSPLVQLGVHECAYRIGVVGFRPLPKGREELRNSEIANIKLAEFF
jgi:hypothetical protein